jgi:hypothetical protein
MMKGARQVPNWPANMMPRAGPKVAPRPNAKPSIPRARPRRRWKNAPTAANSAAACIPSPSPEMILYTAISPHEEASGVASVPRE